MLYEVITIPELFRQRGDGPVEIHADLMGETVAQARASYNFV